MAATYKVISADGHLEIPSDAFAKWVPEKYRDRAPKLVKLDSGGEAWHIEGMPLLQNGPNINGGVAETTPEKFKYRGASYWDEMGNPRPGTGPPQQRLKEQDADGIDAEVLFPPVFAAKFMVGIKERAVYLAMVQAYNNFLAQEYCAFAPDRLIGSAVLPETNVDDAIAEMLRVKKLGLRAVTLNNWPNGGGSPKAEDDKFWAAAIDSDVRLSPHLNFGAMAPPYLDIAAGRIPGDESAHIFSMKGFPPTYTVRLMVTTGVFERFPKLKIYFAETNAGWIPYWFQSLDASYLRTRYWYKLNLPVMPSEYIRRHICFSFVADQLAIDLRHHIGIENLMWGSDFPHLVCTYPLTKQILPKMFAGVPEAEKQKILLDNPIKFFGLHAEKQLTKTA